MSDDIDLNLSIPSGFAVTAAAETDIADDGFTGNIENVVVTVTRDGQSILVIDSLRKEH